MTNDMSQYSTSMPIYENPVASYCGSKLLHYVFIACLIMPLFTTYILLIKLKSREKYKIRNLAEITYCLSIINAFLHFFNFFYIFEILDCLFKNYKPGSHEEIYFRTICILVSLIHLVLIYYYINAISFELNITRFCLVLLISCGYFELVSIVTMLILSIENILIHYTFYCVTTCLSHCISILVANCILLAEKNENTQ